MAFKVRRRGKVTYYYEGDTPVLSNLVVETLPDGDLKKKTTEQPATFAKKDVATEGAPASKVDVSRSASDNAPVTDASKRHAGDAGKSQR